MKELRRILSNRQIIFGLALILLVNVFLYAREQTVHNYGLDCSLPASSVYVFSDELSSDTIDAKTAYSRYLQWLDKSKLLSNADAVSMLEKEIMRLEDIQTISGMLNGTGGIVSVGSSLDIYRDEQPELVRQIENGEIDLFNVDLDYIAVTKLLVQLKYLNGYGDWLNTIQKNKDNMLTFSIFNDPNSFSGRNIIKTAEEFDKLHGADLSLGADGAVNSLMSFKLTDYFLLIALLMICLSFLDERKAGLWNVIHAAPGGRLRLAMNRTIILSGASIVFVTALYGTNLAIGFLTYGGIDDLGRAVQSVETLGKFPMLCSIGEFLIFYFLFRIATAFFVSLLLWFLLTVVNNVKYTIIVTTGVLIVEYGFYTLLPVQSVLNGLKYFNVFTYISLSDLYTQYLNIDLFGYPLGIRSISQLALFPLCLLLASVCVLIQCNKNPAAGKDFLERIAYRINSITDKVLRRLRLFGMETYKSLWIQKGIVIVALFVYVTTRLSFAVNIPVNFPAEAAARQYITEFGGEITNETFTRMDELSAELDRTITEFDAAKIAYQKDKLTLAQFNLCSYNAETARINLEGLGIVRGRAEEIWNYSTEKGFTPWLIDETPFESVYGTAAKKNQHKAAIAAVLTLTLILAGNMAYERQSGMTFLHKATPRGRVTLLSRKILLSALSTVAVWIIVYGMELHSLVTDFSIETWSVPVQNLSMMSQFPINCSISMWLVILYGYRLWALFCGALLVLLISSLMKRIEASYILSCGIMLIPSLLYAYVNIDVLRPVSYIVGVEAMPLFLSENGGVLQFVIWITALTAIAVFAIVRLFVSSNNYKKANEQ